MYLAVLRAKVVDVAYVAHESAVERDKVTGHPGKPEIKEIKEVAHDVVAKAWVDDRPSILDKHAVNDMLDVYEMIFDENQVVTSLEEVER
jgi:hypothetical protein